MMEDKDIMECCLAVLAFLCDESSSFNDCETMKEMDRVLAKNDFFSSVYGTNMVGFMRWLSHEYCFDSPDRYDDMRAYFSDGHTYAQAPAKTFLRFAIGEIREKRLKEILC